MLFRCATCLSFVSLSLIAAFAFFLNVRIRPSDEPAYHRFVQERAELRSHSALEERDAHQSRGGVQKDIWVVNGEQRLHFRLMSEHSEITLHQKKGKMEVIEDFQQLHGWIQEGEQSIGKITAQEGTYYYPSHRFLFGKFHAEHPEGTLKAEQAILKELQPRQDKKRGMEFFLEGGVSATSNCDQPLSISSRRAFCTFFQETSAKPKFSEIQFFDNVIIETLHGVDAMNASGGYAVYKDSSFTLHPAVSDDCCHLYRGQDKIDASEMIFDLHSEELHCLHPRGRVFSQEDQSPLFFSSQALVWKKKLDQIVLSSTLPHRVLVWREGLSLSAPEIRITRDQLTQKESIEGIGDVHFDLESQEKKRIEQLISQYL